MNGDAPSFATDIQPLFRDDDRESMIGMFDLWDAVDVRRASSAILERLEDGTMPCDAPWPAERITTFRRWVGAGCPD